MLSKEEQLRGSKKGSRRQREISLENASNAIPIIKELAETHTLREIAEVLNSKGFRTAQNKLYQQAQIARLKKRLGIDNSPKVNQHTPIDNDVLKKLQAQEATINRLYADIIEMHSENERLRQTDISVEIFKNRLKEALEPFQKILAETNNPDQPRLKKMAELIRSIEEKVNSE